MVSVKNHWTFLPNSSFDSRHVIWFLYSRITAPHWVNWSVLFFKSQIATIFCCFYITWNICALEHITNIIQFVQHQRHYFFVFISRINPSTNIVKILSRRGLLHVRFLVHVAYGIATLICVDRLMIWRKLFNKSFNFSIIFTELNRANWSYWQLKREKARFFFGIGGILGGIIYFYILNSVNPQTNNPTQSCNWVSG